MGVPGSLKDAFRSPSPKYMGRQGVWGWFVATAGCIVALALGANVEAFGRIDSLNPYGWSLTLGALWLVAGLHLRHQPRAGSVFGLGVVLAAIYPARNLILESPTFALSVILLLPALWFFWFFIAADDEPIARERGVDFAVTRLQFRRGVIGGAWTSMLFALAMIPVLPELVRAMAVTCAVLGAETFLLGRRLRFPTRLVGWVLVIFHFAISAALVFEPWELSGVGAMALVAILVGFTHAFWKIAPKSEDGSGEASEWMEILLSQPARLLALTFGGLSLLFFFIFHTPEVTISREPLAWIDALFIAVSAVCVTGLTTIDTTSMFSVWGQVALALAFQIGALGILTFSAMIIFALRGRVSLRAEEAVAQFASSSDRTHLLETIAIVVGYALLIEFSAAIVLTGHFWSSGVPFLEALPKGVFMAISAFCNTGITLESENLGRYVSEPLVLGVMGLSIIAGGLSPLVVLRRLRPNKTHVVPLQDRLALKATLGLIVVGWLAWLLMEWSHSLATLNLQDKFINAWFQSVTARSAGFTSVDIREAHPATHVFTSVLMFIGGSPGGVAGGIKTTTAAILVLSVLSTIQGRQRIQIGFKNVSHGSIYRAAATAFVMGALVVGFTMLLSLTQEIGLRAAGFEVLSALSTVGLSLGATQQLDEVGKLIIVVCMFVGRLGPLSLFFIISSRLREPQWHLAEEDVEVG